MDGCAGRADGGQPAADGPADLEDPTDLLLDAQEALRLLDLPAARAALTRLMQEGGEASRPCAQAARAALDACDWQGAATCLDQLAPLARERG